MSNPIKTPTKSRGDVANEKEAHFHHIYIVHSDTAYYNAYAIHLGYPSASSLPSSSAYPALPRPDLTIEPRQRDRLVLALGERRLNEWQDNTR